MDKTKLKKAFWAIDKIAAGYSLSDAIAAGAIYEAERGREQMAAFAEWVDDNDFRQKSKGIWENLNGTSRTTAELLDLFLDTQKKKG